jgi:KaiC/GvpD/RAD55 family RecA-like ATPase
MYQESYLQRQQNTSNSQAVLVSANRKNRLPYLWVSNFLTAEPLKESFAGILSPLIPPAGKPSGHHILALDPDAPEALWREIAYRLLAAGCEVSINEVGTFGRQPLEWFIADMGASEVVMDLLSEYSSFEEWEEVCADRPLKLKEALQIAELVLRLVPDEQTVTITLDNLRRRAGVSEYNWDKKYLDQLKQKLERDYLANQSSSEEKPTSREERLNLEIKALIKEHEPIKRLFGVNDIATRYSLSKNDVYLLIREIGRDTQTPEVESFSFDELLDQESEGIRYLIPGMLPKGETVLCAGMPKTGKTLLATDAAFAVATGESRFLGEEVEQGKVLLVSVDESAQSTKAKLLKRGFRRGDQLEVMTRWNISQLDDLESKLELLRPKLVIIDSLKRITLGREISENSAEFADMIYQLKELINKYGASAILIHHTNKNVDAVGLERVRGSTAIAGAVWGTWILDRIQKPDPDNKKRMKIDPADPTRILSITPRDCAGQELRLELNPDNLSFGICAAETEEQEQLQQEKQTQQQRILDLLTKSAPKGLTGREIIDGLNLSRSAYNTLSLMVERRLITQRQSKTDHRSMVYCSILPPPPPTDDENMTNLSQSTVVESKTNSHEIVTMTKKISHPPEVENELYDECNQEPVLDTEDSHVVSSGMRGGEGEQIESPVITPSLSLKSDKTVETTSSETTEEVEAPVIQDWQIAEAVTVHIVDPKIKSLMKWNGLQGIVETVNEVSLQCLVRFIVDGLEQAHYIPFRYLRR